MAKTTSKQQRDEWLNLTVRGQQAIDFGIVEKLTGTLSGHARVCQLRKKNDSGAFYILSVIKMHGTTGTIQKLQN
jgi:hypothetical protein